MSKMREGIVCTLFFGDIEWHALFHIQTMFAMPLQNVQFKTKHNLTEVVYVNRNKSALHSRSPALSSKTKLLIKKNCHKISTCTFLGHGKGCAPILPQNLHNKNSNMRNIILVISPCLKSSKPFWVVFNHFTPIGVHNAESIQLDRNLIAGPF
jgi:hypothetical protein